MGENFAISGHRITKEDIEVAAYLTETYRRFSRKELARTLCCCQGWVTQRDMPMLDLGVKVLERLEGDGKIVLPPKNEKMAVAGRRRMKEIPITQRTDPKQEVRGNLSGFDDVSLQPVLTTGEKELWKEYVERYHPEKHAKIYGTNLRYWIKLESNAIGCMLFSSSCWAIEDRDRWIGWSKNDRRQRLIYVVNQSRFLIFPWVGIRNLASHALGLAARRIQSDWLENFLYAPVLLETFVDSARYHGTSYKAANWRKVGTTKGRGRQDRFNEYLSTPRDIYVYPLMPDFRCFLLGEKAPITRE